MYSAGYKSWVILTLEEHGEMTTTSLADHSEVPRSKIMGLLRHMCDVDKTIKLRRKNNSNGYYWSLP